MSRWSENGEYIVAAEVTGKHRQKTAKLESELQDPIQWPDGTVAAGSTCLGM